MSRVRRAWALFVRHGGIHGCCWRATRSGRHNCAVCSRCDCWCPCAFCSPWTCWPAGAPPPPPAPDAAMVEPAALSSAAGRPKPSLAIRRKLSTWPSSSGRRARAGIGLSPGGCTRATATAFSHAVLGMSTTSHSFCARRNLDAGQLAGSFLPSRKNHTEARGQHLAQPWDARKARVPKWQTVGSHIPAQHTPPSRPMLTSFVLATNFVRVHNNLRRIKAPKSLRRPLPVCFGVPAPRAPLSLRERWEAARASLLVAPRTR